MTFPWPLRALVTLAAAVVLALPATADARTLDADGDPITNDAGVVFGIQAHRGGKLEWPQNSVQAFMGSATLGVDVIETDIVFTRDGHGVMNHNDTLTSRCTSTGKAIHAMTLAQVAKVRCANLAGAKVVPLATFEELVGVLATATDVWLNLDIKTYHGQSAKGRRTWAARAVSLVLAHDLASRTRITSFQWADILPTVRARAPKMYVLAIDDHQTLDLGRVRLAARLGANGFALRMASSSAYLAGYVGSLGMDFVPWDVADDEGLAFAIHFAGSREIISTDTPAATRKRLLGGGIDLNPEPHPTTTTLSSPVLISRATYRAGRRHYPAATKAVPRAALPMLRDVTLAVTVTGGPSDNSLSVGACDSPLAGSTTVALPRGTGTVTLTAALGNGRKLRIFTTRTSRLTVKVLAYTRVRFPAA